METITTTTPLTTTYRITRFYADDRPSKTIREGASLEEARDHCNDPDTSVAYQWFDGFEAEVLDIVYIIGNPNGGGAIEQTMH